MEFFDFDEFTGITRYFEYDDETGEAHIRAVQDVEPILKRNAEIRATGEADKTLRRDDYYCKYAEIPMVVVMALKKKGIDVFDKNDGPRLMKELNTNYPYLKTTYLTHDR